MILTVCAGGIPVGILTHQPTLQRWAFQYDSDWLDRHDRYPLSPALPLDPPKQLTAEQHSSAVRIFFENLLPEGQALDDAAATYKLSRSNTIGLLLVLGRETAGALEIFQAGSDQLRNSASRSPERAATDKRALPREELAERIKRRPQLPFTVWDGRVRLSIAGYQDKLAVFEDDGGGWHLVEGSALASTHLIKPEPVSERLAGMTTNEYLCMMLASAAGLATAPAHLETIPHPVLVVERFDRIRRPERVERLHCIDGCQALGLPVSLKYERPYGSGRDVRHLREGASLRALFDLVTEHSPAPARDRISLLRWTIFQILIGNVDAHAKNISFRLDASGMGLAPAYDLVCGLAYEGIEDTLALAIGDEFTPTQVTAADWAQFAINCALPPKLVALELDALASRCLDALGDVSRRVVTAGGSREMADRVVEVIRSQAARVHAASPRVVDVARSL